MNDAHMSRTSQRGFVLIAALVLAVLYLGLIELLLIDGTRAQQEAQRLRARVVAATLAESGAEAAAELMVTKPGSTVSEEIGLGSYEGEYVRQGSNFEITGSASSSGPVRADATVRLQGRIEGNRVMIDYAFHSQ